MRRKSQTHEGNSTRKNASQRGKTLRNAKKRFATWENAVKRLATLHIAELRSSTLSPCYDQCKRTACEYLCARCIDDDQQSTTTQSTNQSACQQAVSVAFAIYIAVISIEP
jgi:hypothetical protein